MRASQNVKRCMSLLRGSLPRTDWTESDVKILVPCDSEILCAAPSSKSFAKNSSG